MSTALAQMPPTSTEIEKVLLTGDLGKLTPDQRLSYYKQVCESLRLNPLTGPFQYISLNGKLVLYATRQASEQLRQRDAVSLTITNREEIAGVYVVTARAIRPDGRIDESTGAVTIEGLKGEARANAMMKAETKSKRRVTLSICGLGMLDETETESIPEARGSREAQKEALDRELAKFPKQLEAPTPITPEQLADVEPVEYDTSECDEHTGSREVRAYEQRETAKTAEAETIVKESAKAAPLRKRGSISFKALESIGAVKKELRQWSGDDAIYYAVLEQAGVAHADEVKNDAAGRTLYKVLAARLNSLKVEKEARQTLLVAQDVLGRESFEAVCRPFVAPSDDGGFIEPALLLPGDDWTKLVGALKSAVDAKQAKPEVHGIRILRLKDLRDQAGGDAFWKVLGTNACDTLELAAQSAEYDAIVQGLVSVINAKERA